jgi:hypothetical protein
MQFFASLFVGKPLSILAIAALFLAAYFIQRCTGFISGRHPRSLIVVAVAWAVYAAWEWLVFIPTPDANIRIDLDVVVPALTGTAWRLVVYSVRFTLHQDHQIVCGVRLFNNTGQETGHTAGSCHASNWVILP